MIPIITSQGGIPYNDAALKDKDAEITRLRAELRQERVACANFEGRLKEAERERDEALAQVAVLWQIVCTKVLARDQPSSRSQILDKARALLDRLQRAEAVVEAAIRYDEAIRSCADDPEKMSSYCTATGKNLDALYLDWITKALAAWEEGTA